MDIRPGALIPLVETGGLEDERYRLVAVAV